MFFISSSKYLQLKQLFENSDYSIIISTYESEKDLIELLTTHEQIVVTFFYFQSILKTNSMKTILETLNIIQKHFATSSLDNIDLLIYYTIIIMGFGAIGNFDQELTWYNACQTWVKENLSELINSKGNYWYYYYILVSAKIQIKLKNYSSAYDMLKQSSNHFSHLLYKMNSDLLMLSQLHTLLGQLHRQTNYLDMAVNNYKSAIDWSLQAHNLEYTRQSYLNLSLTYEEQTKEYLALQTGQELLNIIEKYFDNDQFSLSSANNLIGNIYNRMGEFELAKDYYLRAFAVITDFSLLEKIKSYNFNNMGVISFKLGDFSEALIYFSQALELAKVKQDPRELSFYYANIGEVYLELDKLDDAYENELHAITYLNILNNEDHLVETYFVLVRICLEQKNYIRADHYINEIQKVAVKTKRNVHELKYKLSKAIKLKKEQKFEESKEIFLTVLENPLLSYDLESIALTELAGMLLYSIVKFKAQNYEDLEKIVQKLLMLGKQKKSLPVICSLAVLLSRIKLLSGKYQSGEEILSEALQLCIEKNVEYFKKKIQDELEFCHEIKILSITNPESGRGHLIERFGSSEAMKRIRDLQRLMLSSD